MELQIELTDHREIYHPFEKICGVARWNLEAPARMEVRLFWYTEGKGTQDVGIVARVAIAATSLSGQHPFEFTLPQSPYTYHGRLLSIRWAIELIPAGAKEAEVCRFVLTPWDGPVQGSQTSFSPLRK